MKKLLIISLPIVMFMSSCGGGSLPENPLEMNPESFTTACDCADAMLHVAEYAEKQEDESTLGDLEKMYNKIHNNCLLRHKIESDEIKACPSYDKAEAIVSKL